MNRYSDKDRLMKSGALATKCPNMTMLAEGTLKATVANKSFTIVCAISLGSSCMFCVLIHLLICSIVHAIRVVVFSLSLCMSLSLSPLQLSFRYSLLHNIFLLG